MDWSASRQVLAMLLVVTPLLVGPAQCEPPGQPPPPPPPPDEPCANSDPLRQPFFGDLHVHTGSSLDADLQGTRLDPDGAYAFATGATVDIQPFDENGNALRSLQIDRVLDFAMVSDHAEFLGETSICTQTNPPPCPQGSEDPYCSVACQNYRENPVTAFQQFNSRLSLAPQRLVEVCGSDGQLCFDESITLWNDIQAAAEDAYDRCTFTSFVGYEWTGSPATKNLHRNVVFRNAEVPTRPTSYFEAAEPETLWDALETDCADDGDPSTVDCEFLTIPHNSNLSGGLYFDTTGYDAQTAARRQLHEPLAEVIQHKGSSECLDFTGNDELCGFEFAPYTNLFEASTGTQLSAIYPQDFVRSALKEGLRLEQELGANPFKYGMVGGTDTHLGTPGAVSERGYPGHGGAGPAAMDELPQGLADDRFFNPGGLTVLWAEENTRNSLFSAMRRREAYATSGTRPIVRFFGGAGNVWNLCEGPEGVEGAYEWGVPMGGDLPNGIGMPFFAAHVLKDPMGADIQSVQVIKGWVDENGVAHEEVWGAPSDNGAGVDPDTCEPTGAGDSEKCMLWVDGNFDPSVRAFYYLRVVENPTCRWTTHQCIAAGVDCSDPTTVTDGFEGCCARHERANRNEDVCGPAGVDCEGGIVPPGFEDCCGPRHVPETIRERAWTSPIWYTPAGGGT